jgi:iron complex transport system permease protein
VETATVAREAPAAGVRPQRRKRAALAAVGLALPVCAVLSLAVGARAVPPAEVWSALVAFGGSEGETVVRSLRVPRTLLGLAAGCALGLAGALAQGHTRNPLADPVLLGVGGGASLATVVAIRLGMTEPLGYVWFALAGALAVSVLVFVLAAGGRRSASAPLTLALAGVTVSTLLVGLITGLLLLEPSTLDGYRFWVVGSIAGRGADVLLAVLPFLAVGAVVALAQGPVLNALGLGDDVARGLGLRVGRARLAGVAAITLLTGGAVAACGPIAFVGLVAPHVARAFTGPDHRWLIPLSGAIGAVLLLVADVLGRVVARPGELQVGVALAFVGAPFFIALVRRRRLAGV